MSNIDLIKSLEKNILLSKGTLIQKLKKAPIRLIYSKILELFSLWFQRPVKIDAQTFWNENMLVVIPETVSLSIYRYSFFEANLTRMILQYLKPGTIFFDIGAHFGYYTLLASYIVGKKGQVHSFEPTLDSFNILKTNVSDRNNIFLNNCAVFSKRKNIFINDYGIQYSAFNSLYNPRLPLDKLKKIKIKKYEVKAISIDNYVERKNIFPNFIKIDAESSEYEILLGMQKTIDKFHPIITIEVGDAGVEGILRSKELINFLINKNYQPYECKEGEISKHNLNNKYPYPPDNILFLP